MDARRPNGAARHDFDFSELRFERPMAGFSALRPEREQTWLDDLGARLYGQWLEERSRFGGGSPTPNRKNAVRFVVCSAKTWWCGRCDTIAQGCAWYISQRVEGFGRF
jgi:hypothetical protein